VSNTEFEGGGDGRGHGDYNFLVKQAQASHINMGTLILYCSGSLQYLRVLYPAIVLTCTI
jgi:hypothetical protein